MKSRAVDVSSETVIGISSAREAARRWASPPFSVRNILHGVLKLYPYKLQSLHELLPADTAHRKTFATWTLSKISEEPQWLFNVLWTDGAHFTLHRDVNGHDCRIWATSNPREYLELPLHSPKLTVWYGFTGSFILGPYVFETLYPNNEWTACTVNAEQYLTPLRDCVVLSLQERNALCTVIFMQHGATSHIAHRVMAFLIETLGAEKLISRNFNIELPPMSSDLTPADLWLWGYLKSRVYQPIPSILVEFKEAIRREVAYIHPDMLHSSVSRVVTCL